MHPINQMLSRLGIVVARASRIRATEPPADFLAQFQKSLEYLKANRGDFVEVYPEFRYEVTEAEHPASNIDHETAFAASCLYKSKPSNILDIGSYRHFVIGLLAHYPVTTVDVRKREPISSNETVLTCDAKDLKLPDHSFDAVVTLCAFEHFGLGRYGDTFDPDGDRKAIAQMIRVLRPGGHLIFTTTLHKKRPAIAFNAHRIYDRPLIHKLCSGLELVEERYYSQKLGSFCDFSEVTEHPTDDDIYCGWWKKPAH
jgi:SAM-dependent methyltransferase